MYNLALKGRRAGVGRAGIGVGNHIKRVRSTLTDFVRQSKCEQTKNVKFGYLSQKVV